MRFLENLALLGLLVGVLLSMGSLYWLLWIPGIWLGSALIVSAAALLSFARFNLA